LDRETAVRLVGNLVPGQQGLEDLVDAAAGHARSLVLLSLRRLPAEIRQLIRPLGVFHDGGGLTVHLALCALAFSDTQAKDRHRALKDSLPAYLQGIDSNDVTRIESLPAVGIDLSLRDARRWEVEYDDGRAQKNVSRQ